MMLYQKIKTFLVVNKRRFAFIACGAVVFVVGYGTGRSALLPLYNNAPQGGGKYPNYTTSGGAAPKANSAPKTAKPAGDPACPVKGNVASAKEKKYYLAGDRGYAQVKPEQCFATEAEAVAAGFTAAASPK
jgi:hypothetical protein